MPLGDCWHIKERDQRNKSQEQPVTNSFSFFSFSLLRMFGMSGACNACGQTIQPNEMVMRTTSGGSGNSQTATGAVNGGGMNGQMQHQVFHPSCFACSKCAIQLKPGDR